MAPSEPTIKVRAHREEERVIYAGAPAAAEAAQSAPPSADAPASGRQAHAGEAVADPAAANGPSAPADPFRETTLDDIESSTMSGLQKGIIVGAVLLIAACIAWYVLFMS